MLIEHQKQTLSLTRSDNTDRSQIWPITDKGVPCLVPNITEWVFQIVTELGEHMLGLSVLFLDDGICFMLTQNGALFCCQDNLRASPMFGGA